MVSTPVVTVPVFMLNGMLLTTTPLLDMADTALLAAVIVVESDASNHTNGVIAEGNTTTGVLAYGVALTALDAVPSPAGFTAFKRTEYDAPFVNPTIVIGLVVCGGFSAVYVVPPSIEYL